ncbi:hypothetical protein HZA76_00130 [Candidatus Roizmanbacteria bacterium]|nr:hypothetical protein [Candidatus Roizmanbacteria bacterium]
MSETIKITGFSDGHQFRNANRYIDTQKLFQELGLTNEVENRTPTVGVNVAHLARMDAVQGLNKDINGRDLSVTILGISTAEGPSDFQKLLKGLGASHISTTAIDISDGIFSEIAKTDLDEVTCLLKDARETGLPGSSQDFNLRDHIANCCPPEIDREINAEAVKILKPGGISIVNITSSDLLSNSQGREVVDFFQLRSTIGEEIIRALQTNIYDLKELAEAFPEVDVESLRGLILEIEPGGSFVVFGEDEQGHGEWFRSIDDHKKLWKKDRFEIVEIATREGKDSHSPPLECMRHNVVLKKKLSVDEK